MNYRIDVKSINPYNNCILKKIIFFQYLPISIGLVDQMGESFDHLRCEVFQNLFLSPMNTGFVRLAVATALTVYSIETNIYKETYALHRAFDMALKDLHKKWRLIYEKRE